MHYNDSMKNDAHKNGSNAHLISELWRQNMANQDNETDSYDHLWEDAFYNIEALPNDWHPSSPHSPVNYIMKDSIQNARDLLSDRQRMIAKSDRAVEMGCRISFAVGAGLYMFSPALSALFMTGSAIVNFINKKMTSKANRHFRTANEALTICDDYERQMPDRQRAIQDLRKTARHLYYWEKTSRVSTTIVKFAAGEIIPMVGAVMSMMEVKDELSKKRPVSTRKPRTSYVLQETIDIMEQNLPYQTTPSHTP